MLLKTDYKDFVAPDSGRKYNISANADGSSNIKDVTQYEQQGNQFGAEDINQTNKFLNAATYPNLSRNSNFANPVNQRGVTTWTSGYGIDCWTIYNGSATVADGEIVVNSGAFNQLLDGMDLTQIYTFTVYAKNGENFTHTGKAQTQTATSFGYIGLDKVGNNLQLIISCNKTSRGFRAVKLEEGSISTPYVPKDYGTEITECKRYLQTLDIFTTEYCPAGGLTFTYSVPYSVPLHTRGIKPTITFKEEAQFTNCTAARYDSTDKSFAFSLITASNAMFGVASLKPLVSVEL